MIISRLPKISRFCLLLGFAICVFALPARADMTQEGAGLLVSDINGALPKALWRDQPRSEILYMFKHMPANSDSRAYQDIKRDMLLSTYDFSLIDNDIPAEDKNSLLTVRLQKLMEIGRWGDALNLYTESTKDPGQNDKLAEVGVTLILLQKGLSTACLEEKVLSTRFPTSLFWQQIDRACNVELGTSGKNPPVFNKSDVLHAIYNDKNYKIAASDTGVLAALTPLELGLIAAKGRINYDKLTLTPRIPPHIIKTFMQDPSFPKSQQAELELIARQKALLPVLPLPELMKTQSENAAQLSQNALLQLIAAKLQVKEPVTGAEMDRLLFLAKENPENYFYVQLLSKIRASVSAPSITPEQYQQGLEAFSTHQQEKVNFLKSLLDKTPEFSNNPANVYEKQISLTPAGDYVIPTGNLQNWLIRTKQHQFAGLSLLIILSNVENNTDADHAADTSVNEPVNVLESLSTVGLIDQAHQIARERLADLMRTTK